MCGFVFSHFSPLAESVTYRSLKNLHENSTCDAHARVAMVFYLSISFKQVYNGRVVPFKQFALGFEKSRFVIWGRRRYWRKKVYVDLGDMNVVELGESDNTNALRNQEQKFCFIIYFTRKSFQSSMYFLCETEEDRNFVVGAIKEIQRVEYLDEEWGNRWLKDMFHQYDVDNSGTLNFKEIVKLMNYLNAGISKSSAKKLFKKSAKKKAFSQRGTERVLNAQGFVDFYCAATRRNEIRALYRDITEQGGLMTNSSLQGFLRHFQQETNITREDVDKIIRKFEPDVRVKNNGRLGEKGFQAFLESPDQMLPDPKMKKISQDMTQPLTHYYIATSNRTGHDGQAPHSVSAQSYMHALLKGCRCVDVPCYEGLDGQPVIYNPKGRRATRWDEKSPEAKTSFKDVIEVINKFAFKASSYPVIVSLKMFCGTKQQQIMVDIMKKVFRQRLWIPDNPDLVTIPSPKDLMNRFIIKGRKGFGLKSRHDNGIACKIEFGTREDIKDSFDDSTVLMKFILASEMDRITGLSDETFNTNEIDRKNCEFVSNLIEEHMFKKYGDDQNKNFERVTQSKLLQICPESSTFNVSPCNAWSVGCQMVAINYMVRDDNFKLNQCMFSKNGGCGYVLKPDYLTKDTSNEDNKSRVLHSFRSLKGRPVISVQVRVISAHHLPKPDQTSRGEIIDPYVTVEVFGVTHDCKQVSTKVVMNNGLNPIWDESFIFMLYRPEVAFLMFRVWDKDTLTADDFIGGFCIPVTSMRQGFRHIQLEDDRDMPIPAALLFTEVLLTPIDG